MAFLLAFELWQAQGNGQLAPGVRAGPAFPPTPLLPKLDELSRGGSEVCSSFTRLLGIF